MREVPVFRKSGHICGRPVVVHGSCDVIISNCISLVIKGTTRVSGKAANTQIGLNADDNPTTAL